MGKLILAENSRLRSFLPFYLQVNVVKLKSDSDLFKRMHWVLIHLLKLILLSAVVISQALGGSSCCCLSRFLISAMKASVTESSDSASCESEQAISCCACKSRSATTPDAKSDSGLLQSQVGERLLPDEKCNCVKNLSLAMDERPRSNVKAFESTFVGTNESRLSFLDTLGPIGPSYHQADLSRSRQHSWQAIACVWLK